MKGLARQLLASAAAITCISSVLQVSGVPAGAAMSDSRAAGITFTGTLGHMPAGSAIVLIEAELSLGTENRKDVGPTLEDVVVASAKIQAPTFKITVPISAIVRQAASQNHGFANFQVVVDSGLTFSSKYMSVPLSPEAAPGNLTVLSMVARRSANLGRLPAFRPMGAQVRSAVLSADRLDAVPNLTACVWNTYGSEYEGVAKIGQMHVTNATGMSGTFYYHTQADSTFSIGISAGPTGPWGGNGTLTLTNSLGSTGTWPAGAGTKAYSVGHVYFQRYESDGADTCPGIQFKNKAVSVVGDAWEGSGTPAGNPYTYCTSDPYGYATVGANGGTWNQDRSTALTFSDSVTVWNYNFSSTTGYTSDINIGYVNNNSQNQNLCGTNYMPGVPIIYNGSY